MKPTNKTQVLNVLVAHGAKTVADLVDLTGATQKNVATTCSTLKRLSLIDLIDGPVPRSYCARAGVTVESYLSDMKAARGEHSVANGQSRSKRAPATLDHAEPEPEQEESPEEETDFALWNSGVFALQQGETTVLIPPEHVPALRDYLNRVLPIAPPSLIAPAAAESKFGPFVTSLGPQILSHGMTQSEQFAEAAGTMSDGGAIGKNRFK